MKILFLDVDGVLAPVGSDHQYIFAPECMEQLKRILSGVPDTRIVVSSSWREGFSLFHFGWLWRQHGIGPDWVIDNTPVLDGQPRSEEIKAWLRDSGARYGVDSYAVLDDEPEWLEGLPAEAVFACEGEVGLTEECAGRVKDYLDRPDDQGAVIR